jgi:lysozyme
MTSEGFARLKLDEGCRLEAYPDPASLRGKQMALPASKRAPDWQDLSAEPWTCGYGCTGDGITDGTIWTQDEADTQLEGRVAQVEAALQARLAWFDTLSPVRQDVLVNIAFNIGVAGLMKWPKTLGHVQQGDFAAASTDISSNTVWLNQVHARCTRCADAMRDDQW